MSHDLIDIGKIIHAHAQIAFPKHTKIQNFYFDSRKIIVGENALFIALKTAHRDGHNYIQQAYDQGVRNFLVERYDDAQIDANFLQVKDPLQALQQYASAYRQSLTTHIVGITGSNGKTIVKEWLKSMTKDHHAVFASPNSYNSQLGVALSLLMIQKQHDFAYIECGISQKGEMSKLEQMVLPNTVIITNIGDAHDRGFENREEKVKEKLILAKDARLVICHDSHQQIRKYLKDTSGAISWSLKSIAKDEKSSINILIGHREMTFAIPKQLRSSHTIENLAHAIAYCSIHKLLDHELIQQEINKLDKLNQRLSIHTTSSGLTILDDSFSCDLESMKISLTSFSKYIVEYKSFVILTDFAEEHGDTDQKWAELLPIINASKLTKILFIGKQLLALQYKLKPELVIVNDIVELYPLLDDMIGTFRSCLIKGASRYQLSKVIGYLEEFKSHNTLHINLEALRHNIDFYKRKLNTGTKCIAVIKANAYGSDAKIIAKELVQSSIDYLAVAYLAEGIELRKSGITTPIMVLTPDLTKLELFEYYNLEPQVYDIQLFEDIHTKGKLKIHLNLDTGMNRLGLKRIDIQSLEKIKSRVKVESIYSHIRATEDMHDAENTHRQVSLFLKQYRQITTVLGYQPWKHILNSEGITNYPEYYFDAVRVGIGMYGINYNTSSLLQITHRLESEIIQIKEVSLGETVGYGAFGKVNQSSHIAILPLGYADGILRSLSLSSYRVCIDKRYYPIIGKISMDQMCINLGNDQYPIGTKVEIFGKQVTLQQMASCADTIPYEILCSLSARIKRVFQNA